MAKAQEEISHYEEFDYLVVNDDFGHALADMEAILRSRRLGLERQRVAHGALLEALLD